MSVVDDRTLSAFLAGALEPGLELEVRERISAYPELRERVAILAARHVQDRLLVDAWDVPPPGVPVGMRPFAAHVGRAYVMGTMGPTSLRPGERFTVLLDDLPDAQELFLVVLLRRDDGDWGVVFPRKQREVVTLSSLPLVETDAGDTKRQLQLAAQRSSGRQRWAVALAPMDRVPDWNLDPAERWDGLKRAVRTRSVSVTAVEIEVE